MADLNQNQNNQLSTQSANPVVAVTGGSSPWDEPLPEEKSLPKVVGSLHEEVHYSQTNQPFVVPPEVDEAVPPMTTTLPATSKMHVTSTADLSNPTNMANPTPANSTPAPLPEQLVSHIATNPMAPKEADQTANDASLTTETSFTAQPQPLVTNQQPLQAKPAGLSGDLISRPKVGAAVAVGIAGSLNMATNAVVQAAPPPVVVTMPSSDQDKKTLSSPAQNGQIATAPAAQQAKTGKSPKRFLKLFLFGLLGLLILGIGILGVLVYLTESGKVSFGLENKYGVYKIESLWGGLPIDGERALAMSYLKMREQQNFKVNGTIILFADKSTDSTSIAPIFEALDVAASSGSDVVSDQSVLEGSLFKTLTSEIDAKISPTGNQAKIKISGDNREVNLELKQVQNLLWVNSDQIKFAGNWEKDSWFEYQLAAESASLLPTQFFSADLAKAKASAIGSRVANEKMSDERLYRYTYDQIEIGDSLKTLGITYDMIQRVSGDLWFGVNDHLIKKANIKVDLAPSLPIASLEITLTFNDYGAPNSLEKPTKSIKPETTLGPNFGQDQDQVEKIAKAKENDLKRKSDLMAIRKALLEFRKVSQGYPLAATSQSLRESGNLVEKVLVPNFISVVPKDMNSAAGWSYYYKSIDGQSFILSARLEESELENPGLSPNLYYLSDK